MLCNICQNAFKLFTWRDKGVLLRDIHYSTSEELCESAQLGCRICSILADRWKALVCSLADLHLGPRAGGGLVMCFLYKLAIQSVSGSSGQSEELHVDFHLDLEDVGVEIPEEERSVGFVLVPAGGSYFWLPVMFMYRNRVPDHICRIRSLF
jgi:hypothetical protein